MSPIQQMLLGVGAVATKTYVDDCFSTYLYKGTGSSLSINNGIDVSGEGALVWLKSRSNSYGHKLTDTVRGSTKQLNSDAAAAQSTSSDFISGFTSTGFTLGTDVDINSSSHTYTSWTFRKTPGFFDVVTYTGNGNSNRQISHSLSSIPGLILIKDLSSANDWRVFHRGLNGGNNPAQKYLALNTNAAEDWGSNVFANTDPTATNFSVGDNSYVNNNGSNYVAYVFAGGESTAATARSVDFDGNNSLSLSSTSDFSFPYDFTVEFWALTDSYSNSPYFCDFRDSGSDTGTTNRIVFYTPANTGKPTFWLNGSARITASNPTTLGTWSHYALVRSGSTTTMYINGIAQGTYSDSTSYGNAPLMIGQRQGSSVTQGFDGKISNFRIFRGVAVYTSSFKPSTTPLTGNALTKLLCCNDSSVTGKTYGGTITANGSPTASTDSPFDDPAGFVFGDAEDQGIIKCGSYEGNNADDGTEVFLGFEPSLLLIKSVDTADDWVMFDNLRGITVDGVNDQALFPNLSGSESGGNYLTPTSTGFKLTTQSDRVNNDSTYIYMAIRCPDGYVGKPPELGTGVFAMDTGGSSDTIPNFDSGFPVDWGWYRNPSTASSMWVPSRLTGPVEMKTSGNNAESSYASAVFDSNVGWSKSESNNNTQSWMWKRHAGFDVVAYKGDGVAGRQIPHSLNKTVEMMWVKRRDGTADWQVFHKGLNGGIDPEDYVIKLNATHDNSDSKARWDDTAPTSTHFTLGDDGTVNGNGNTFIAMLFASTDVSKVGYYDGSNSNQTITLGFTPRFFLCKSYSHTGSWLVLDSTRGFSTSWGSTSKAIYLDTNAAESDLDIGRINSAGTGVFIKGGVSEINEGGKSYIYYAHA